MVLVQCPHCKDYFEISKLKCGIFRHAVIKKTMKPLNPHTSDEDINQGKTTKKKIPPDVSGDGS
jgi:hypothetical protein